MSPPVVLLGGQLSGNIAVDAISPQRLRQCSFVLDAPGHVCNRAPVPFAQTVVLWSIGRAELLNDRHGLAVVTVVVGDKLAAAIGTQVLEAKSERHDKGLHEFD